MMLLVEKSKNVFQFLGIGEVQGVSIFCLRMLGEVGLDSGQAVMTPWPFPKGGARGGQAVMTLCTVG